MEDGWCSMCRETTDGRCIHFADGTSVLDGEREIFNLRDKIDRLTKELADARKDTARLDKLQRIERDLLYSASGERWALAIDYDSESFSWHSSVRTAIDKGEEE